MTSSNPGRPWGEWVLVGIAALWFAAIPFIGAVARAAFPALQDPQKQVLLAVIICGLQLGGLIVLLSIARLASKLERLAVICQLLILVVAWSTLDVLLHLLLAGRPNSIALIQLAAGLPFILVLGGWLISQTCRCTLRQAWKEMGLTRTGSLGWGLAAAALVLWPWFLVGSLGDWRESAAIAFQALAAGLLVEWLWRGMALNALLEVSGRRWTAGLIGGFLCAASELGKIALGIDAGPIGIASAFVVTLLVTELWSRPQDTRPGVWGAVVFHTLYLALPRLFIDPRSKEELAHAVVYTAMPILTALVGILLYIERKLLSRLKKPLPPSRLRTALIGAICWGMALAVYIIYGAPGFHNDGYLIVLREQVDLDAAPRDELYHTLVDTAVRSQAPIRQELDAMGVSYRPYYLVNMIRVDGTQRGMAGLKRREDVILVLPNPNVREYPIRWKIPYQPAELSMDAIPWGVDSIEADRVWEMGILGAGIVVGAQDTGYSWQNPELLDSYRGWDGRQADHNRNWHDAWDNQPVPFDDDNHGTHTLGTVLGNTVGMAPDAQWIACRNMRYGIGNPGSYIECMEFFFAPYPIGGDPFQDGDPSMAPNIVNNSWGCPPEEGCIDPEPMRTALKALKAAGILMVVSAGNDGPDCSTVWAPADDASVLAVGASDEASNIVGFSSRGPTKDGLVKPDVSAPGVDIISSLPGGGYGSAGGTSMAGPHVAGLAALLWSADPDLIGDIDRTIEIIISTAHPYLVDALCPADGQTCACGQDRPDLTPNNVAGYGIVDAYAAVEAALAGE